MKKSFEARRLLYFALLWVFAGCIRTPAATLVWDPNPTNEAVLYYTVYIDPAPVGFTPANVLTNRFLLDFLPVGVKLTLSVTATSAAGESLRSSITYPLAPTITQQPTGKVLALGDLLELVVQVSGTPPFDFQWSRNGIVLPGHTNQTLRIDLLTVTDVGDYSVRVWNAGGSDESGVIPVTLDVPGPGPTISEHPQGTNVIEGGQISLSVRATGSEPLFYEWYKGGIPMSGQVGPSLLIPSASLSDGGAYQVRVSNLFGSTDSNPASVTVVVPPSIVVPPAGTNIVAGGALLLSVAASGTSPLAYQWYHNTEPLVNATESTLAIEPVTTANAGSYRVLVSNEAGSVTSDAVSVNVTPPPNPAPIILVQPEPITRTAGEAGELKVEADGAAPLRFQWLKDGQLLPGATNPVLSFSAVVETNSGSYRVTVSNGFGFTTSNPATVSVLELPVILSQPQSAIVSLGATVTLSVSAANALSYQWLKEGQPIVDAENIFLMITLRTENDFGRYSVRVSNADGSVESSPAIIADPATAAGHLTIISAPDGFKLLAQGISGIIYRVEISEDLSAPQWTTLEPVSADINGRFEVEIPSTRNQLFIRTVR